MEAELNIVILLFELVFERQLVVVANNIVCRASRVLFILIRLCVRVIAFASLKFIAHIVPLVLKVSPSAIISIVTWGLNKSHC